MNKRNNRKIKKEKVETKENGEDKTKYGEFISSYFSWVSLPEQKERAEELDSMTKSKKNN